MKAYCLASSSAGNCYVLEFDINGTPTFLMVECGIPLKDVYKKSIQYGLDLSNVVGCLITHAHNDHAKAVRDLIKRGLPIYASNGTLRHLNVNGVELVDYQPKRITDGLYAMAFPVEHDIDGAVGFIIKTKTECVLFVNDHKRWTCNLDNFKPDYIFIECNYDHKVVYAQLNQLQKLKNQGVPFEEERELNIKIAQHTRNLNAHCSLHGTKKGLEKINLKNCKTIFLMHLSDRYANEYKMKNEIQAAFGILTYVCNKNGGFS